MNIEGENSDFDTEKFIKEVESRPALWDLNDEEYSCRDLKKKHWEELVSIFFKTEDASTAEKNEFGKVLQRKWKSLRDCYSRERQRLAQIRSGSSVSRKTQYVFYNHLSFLQSVIKSKGITNNIEEAAAEERPSDGEQPFTSSAVQSVEERGGKRKRVEKVSPEVECLVNALQAGMQSQEEREKLREEDNDRLFLLSLLNPMNKIQEHLRFGVSMDQVDDEDTLPIPGASAASFCKTQMMTTPPPPPPPPLPASGTNKRKHDVDIQRQRILEKAAKCLDADEDEFDIFGKFVGTRLRQLSATQCILAEKQIMEILYNCSMNTISTASLFTYSNENQSGTEAAHSSSPSSRP